MKNKKELIVKENYINIKNITNEDYMVLAQNDNIYFFDTESCPDLPIEVVNKYNLSEVEYDTIEEFKVINEGSLLYQLKKNKQLKSKVYVWMFGSKNSDKVYYGNTIDEFMNFIQSIDTFRVQNKIKVETFNVYVHNLAWDIEYIKYWLKDNNYTQLVAGHNHNERLKTQKEPLKFDIVENDGITFNGRIQMDIRKVGRKNIMTSIQFNDSLKITPISLSKISKELISIDEIYIKNSDIYQYNLVRNEKEYQPTLVEAFYQYCDIYILKEWWNQFIVENYINEGITPYTISQISFESILAKSFAKDKKEGKYDHLMDKKGNIDDRRIYENHYGLKLIENHPNVKEYIQLSYKGGITTLSKKHKELAVNNKINGVSIDICSSYPSQIVYKPLPYGAPTGIKEGKYEDVTMFGKHYNFHFITIGFDGWHSVNHNNTFGLPIKIHNLTDEEKIAMNWTPNEIYTTNCVNFEYVGSNRIIVKDKKRAAKLDKLPYRYIITLTHYEYEMYTKLFNFVHIENGEILDGVKFIDYISFESEVGYMKEGIEYYYNLKEEGTKEGNKSKVFNSKIIINSFYGKNCAKRNRQQRMYNFEKDIITFKSITDGNKNEWMDDKMYAIQYGSAITSWGRIQLMETVYKLGCDKFVYADTDSIKIEGINKEELIVLCNENGVDLSISKEEKQLGRWDYEYSYEDFKAIAQKKYMYKVEGDSDYICKCSGLPEDIRKTIKNKSQFNLGSKFIKNGKTKVIGGYLLLPTEFTINDNSII